MGDPVQQFRDALSRRGIIVSGEIIADGRIHRCDAEGRNGKGDAAYLLHLNGVPAGGCQNWRDGLGWEDWRADIGRSLTQGELAAQRASAQTTRREREVEEARRQAEARKRAAAILDHSQPASADHPYLKAKGVQAHGLYQYRDALVVPMRDADGELHSLQFIRADGTKRFLTGGRKQGCYLAIGKPDSALCIAEGYATAASVQEATGCAVAVAFDCGNLEPVARALRARFPELRLIVCADDDAATPGNPGLTKATAAARAIGGFVAVPDFGRDRPEAAKDFNDLALYRGVEAVRKAVEAARAPQNENATKGAVADRKLILEPIGKLLAEPEESTPWLVEGLLPAGGISVLAARPKVGKSTLARDLAIRVCRGEAFLGLHTMKGAVYILDLEGKRGETVNALRRLGAAEADGIKVFCGTAPRGALGELKAQALAERPVLIVVDTMQRLARIANMNDYSEVSLVLDDYIALARETGAHLMLLHHQGRSEGDGVDAPMGSTAISGSMDTILTMKRRKDDNATRTMSSRQRYGTDLEETVIVIDAQGRVSVDGLAKDHDMRDAEARIIDYLTQHRDAEQSEIKEGVEGRWAVVRKALTALCETGRVTRAGSGKKGDPFKYSNSGSAGSWEPREPENQHFGSPALLAPVVLPQAPADAEEVEVNL